MPELTSLLPEDHSINIGGREFSIQPFTVNEFAKIQAWINRNYKSPLADILSSLGSAEPVIRKEILFEAKSWVAPQLGTADANAALNSVEGMREVFRIAVQKADKSITTEAAETLMGSVPFAEFNLVVLNLMKFAFGTDEEEGPKV